VSVHLHCLLSYLRLFYLHLPGIGRLTVENMEEMMKMQEMMEQEMTDWRGQKDRRQKDVRQQDVRQKDVRHQTPKLPTCLV